MTPTFCIVPVRDQWQLTQAFLRSIHGDQDIHDVLILDNGSTDQTPKLIRSFQHRSAHWKGRLHRVSLPGLSIYQLWNYGFARARQLSRGEFNVLVCNNDVELAPRTAGFLDAYLRVNPEHWVAYPDVTADWGARVPLETRETLGVFGDGGMFGPCFMLAGERIPWRPLITDDAYQWWYGDNHLAECIHLAGGRQVRVVGLPIRHVNEGTAQHYPELWQKKLHDRGQWITRHGRGYGVAP